MTKVFISYSHEDQHFARKVADKLIQDGYDVWLDQKEILVGDSVAQKIMSGIKECDYFMVVISENSVNSKWVQKELEVALSNELNVEKPKILPIKVDNTDVPEFLKDKLYADFRDNIEFNHSYKQLIEAMPSTEEPEKKKTIDSVLGTISLSFVSGPTTASHVYPLLEEPVVTVELETYEDINMINIDTRNVNKAIENTLIYNIPIILSKRPPKEWSEIFESERKFPRHSTWRKARIEGDRIIIKCPITEFKEIHEADLRQDVSKTNEMYRKYLLEDAKKRDIESKKAIDEQKMIEDNLKDIKF